jgi:hypothetical protein
MRVYSSWCKPRLVSEPEDEGISAYSSAQINERLAKHILKMLRDEI